MSGSNSPHISSPATSSRVPAVARAVVSAFNHSKRNYDPPEIDLEGVDFRELTKHIIQSNKFAAFKGQIGQILSFALIPTVWPTAGLPALRKAAAAASKSGACGKTWKQDAIAYKCKTCERDSTCVICVECFRAGDHTGHDVSILRTAGGCCDCGDPEAWRPEGFCRHHPGPLPEHIDPSKAIDPVLRRNIIGALQAVAELLLWLCLSNYPRERNKFKFAELACELLDWLLQISECGDGFRRLVGTCLTDPSQWPPTIVNVRKFNVDMTKVSWLQVMLRLDGLNRMNPNVQDALHKLYFQLITNLSFKRSFLELFMLNYESYMHANILNRPKLPHRDEYDSEEAEDADIAQSFAVQLFTVPALIPLMIQEGGLLEILLDVTLNSFEACASPVRPYGKPIPYEQSNFAHRSSQSSRDVHVRPSSPKASPSSDHGQSLKRRRRALPLPFPAKLMQNAAGSSTVQAGAIKQRSINDRREENGRQYTRNLGANQCDIIETESRHQRTEMSDHDAHQELGESDSNIGINAAGVANEAIWEGQHDRAEPAGYFNNPGSDNRTEGAESAETASDEPGFYEGEKFLWESDEFGHADNDEQIAVFESGMRFTPNSSETITSLELSGAESRNCRNQTYRSQLKSKLKGSSTSLDSRAPAGRLLRAVRQARMMEDSAISGQGPLAHTLRLNWVSGQSKVCEGICRGLIDHLKYVLTHRAVGFHLLHVRKDLFRKFVRLVSMAQGMNPFSRKFGDSVSTESDTSDKSISVERDLFHLVGLLSDVFCGKNLPSEVELQAARIDMAKSRLECVRIVRTCLDEWLDREEALEARSVFVDELFSVAHSVSIHLPLHRLLAFMMHHIIRQDGVNVREAISGGSASTVDDEIRRLVRHPLRISAFFSQVRAGMWKRNGSVVGYQERFYFSTISSDWFLDLDLFMHQCCAVILGPRIFTAEAEVAFCIRDLEKCLYAFSSERLEREARNAALSGKNVGLHPLAPRNEQSAFDFPVVPDCGSTFAVLREFLPKLIEDFFVLVVRVASERGKCGLGESQILRRKLIHQLCSRDKPYSQLTRMVSSSITNGMQAYDEEGSSWEKLNTLVHTIIGEIGDYIEPKGMQQGRYRLKRAVWREFDPFEPHLSASERNAAFVEHEDIRMELGTPRQIIPLDNVNERPLFPQLRELCDLSAFQAGPTGIATKLLRVFYARNDAPQVIENSLPAALHLSCMAVEKCSAVDSRQPYWRDYDPHGDRAGVVAFGIIVKLHERHRTAEYGYRSDIAPIMRRIIHEAIVRVNPNLHPSVAEFLRRGGEKWGIAGTQGGSSSPFGNVEASQKVRNDEKRREILKKRKLQQQAAMAQMRQQQSKFAEFIESSNDGSAADAGLGDRAEPGSNRDTQTSDNREACQVGKGVCYRNARAAEKTATHPFIPEEYECVLCHGSGGEDEDSLLGLIGFHQKSRLPLIAKEQSLISSAAWEPAGVALQEDAGSLPRPHTRGMFRLRRGSRAVLGQKPNSGQNHEEHENRADLQDSFILNTGLLRYGVENSQTLHLSFCGHAVHIRCFDRYFSSLISTRDEHRIYEGYNILNLDKLEFLCPVCRRLANVVFPLVTGDRTTDGLETQASGATPGITASYDEWLQRCDCDAQKRASNGEIAGNTRFHGDPDVEMSESGNKANEEAPSPNVISVTNPRNSIISRGERVLQRFSLQSSGHVSVAGASSPRNSWDVRSRLSSYSTLPSAAITTAACAEIASRTLPWNGNELRAYRKSVALVLQRIRAHVGIDQDAVQKALRLLWMETRSPNTAKYLDPFATFAFLFLLWPESRLVYEIRYLVQVGLQLMCLPEREPSLRNKAELTYEVLLYLRQCSIFISTAIDRLAMPPISSYQRSEAGYEAIMREIGDLTKYFEIPNVPQLALLCSGKETRSFSPYSLLRFRPKQTGLIKLPDLYQTLLESLEGRRCEGCRRSPNPHLSILCLSCGVVFCENTERCGHDRLSAHAMSCGSGIGVFLFVGMTNVFILRDERSSIWGSPYLDAHGEEDDRLRRGKPLYLSEARYSALGKLWLTNSFDQDPRILRLTVPNLLLGGQR